MRAQRAFTLIELLIVIAIIGLLATLAVFAVASARQRSRDARRVSDMKQMRNALELYAIANRGYPLILDAGIVLGEEGGAECLGNDGFVTDGTDESGNPVPGGDAETVCGAIADIYIRSIPKNPSPGGRVYLYRGVAPCSAVCADYTIDFSLEGPTAGLLDASGDGFFECVAGSASMSCR